MAGPDREGLDTELLRRVIASTRDAVVFIDEHAKIIYFNDAACAMFGYSRDEILYQPVATLMPEPYASNHDGYIARFEQTHEARAVGQIRRVMGRRSNGVRFPCELSVTAIDNGGRARYSAFLRDVSERAQLERQLDRNQRLASVGMVASMFAHEVGNPLNNMFIHAQLLQRSVARHDLGERVGPSVGLIMDELRRLRDLLFEFRELYQPPAMVLAPVSLTLLLDELIGTPMLQAERIEVSRDIPPGLPAVIGHQDKLRQVFVNLCKNAIEAMPEGGALVIRARGRGELVEVEIEDTGHGIPEGLEPFEAFHTTKKAGSGLGLAVVRQIVRDHGGDVAYRSAAGEGTTFTVSLRAYA